MSIAGSSDLTGGLDIYVSLFRKPLDTCELPDKRPSYKLRDEWDKAVTGPGTVPHLFSSYGFSVWFAYFRTKRKCQGGKHYVGQKDDNTTFSEFQKLSESEQKKVATALSKVVVHPEVRIAVLEGRAKSSFSHQRRSSTVSCGRSLSNG
jgi:hypothetical protein